jgi:hypothetical protein
MNNYTDVMLDLETLSVRPNAQVLSIAAVGFNPFDPTPDYTQYPTLDLLLSLDEQEHRDIQEDTLNWWNYREPEIINKIFAENGRVAVDDALDQLSKFCWNRERIWAQGVTLDISVLTHLYEERGKGVPWPYHIVRDSRTLLDLVEVEQPPVTHDSLADCFRQIMGVQQALQQLGIQKFIRAK